MGLAASQARLLSLTARIHDVEYEAQQIQNAKLQLALQEDAVYQKYMDALDKQTLTFKNANGQRCKATFDNLFGEGSINNGPDERYVLYTNDGELVLPDKVFDAYADYVGDSNGTATADPYAFAMYMAGGCTEDEFKEAENEFTSNNSEKIQKALSSSYTKRNDALQALLKAMGMEGMTEEELSEKFVGWPHPNKEEIMEQVGDGIDCDEFQKLVDAFIEADKEYETKIYDKYKSQIYQSIPGNEDEKLDTDTFNYYLMYAKLIEIEEGLAGCTRQSVYKYDLNSENNLYDMMSSGKVYMEVVSMKNGEIDKDVTSPATDSDISYQNASDIDSKELKIAEAEYERAMKKIDQKDKRFDMDLNKLETERTALTTEYDSVKKVIQDNIERTFGIFS